MDSPEHDEKTAQPAGPSRRRPRRRWGLAAVVVVAAGVIAAWLAGPRVLASIVASQLEPTLGGEVSIASIRPVDWGRRWVATDLVVRARNWSGKAAETFRLDRVEAVVDRATLTSGAPVVQHLRVDGGRVRLAERRGADGDLEINLLDLVPESGEEESPGPIPTIDVRNLRFESGEDLDGTWIPAGHRVFAGEIRVDPAAPELLDIKLRETDDAGRDLPSGLLLVGSVDTEREEASLRVQDLALGPDALRIAPPSVRRLCEEFELDGELGSITFEWTPGGRLQSTLAIEDLSLRLDVGGEPWARFRDGVIESGIDPPRLRVTEGLIEIDGEHLELIGCRGVLGGEMSDTLQVPFALGFRIDLLASAETGLDWTQRREVLEQVLGSAPFVLDLAIADFGTVPVAGDAPDAPAIELPLVAARILEKLGARAWELGVQLHVERGPALSYRNGVPVPADLEQSGQLRLRDGEGSYFRFPYPLTDVAARLDFEGERVEIVELTGRGPTGADVSIAGELLLPAGDVAVDIVISSPNLPVDEHLVEALQNGPRRLIEELFDRDAAARLGSLDLLENERSLAAAAELASALETRLGSPEIDVDTRSRIESELAALDRRIAAGPFRFGGLVDVDLRIRQGLGKDAPLVTTGTIDVGGNGVVLKGFHYPVVVGAGRIVLEDERIVLEGLDPGDGKDEGIPFTTPGGGQGLVSGEIDIPRRRDPVSDERTRGFEPRVAIEIRDDRPTAALLATIEPPRWIAPEEACPRRWADLLDARGTIDIAGRLLPDPGGGLEPDWAFTADLLDVRARLRPPLVEAIASLDLEWPTVAAIDQLQGRLALVPGEVAIEGLVGRLEQPGPPASIEVSGAILPRASSLDVRVACRGLDARTWFEAAHDPTQDSMWLRRDIAGSVDAEVALRRTSGEGEILTKLVGGRIEIDGTAASVGDAAPRIGLELQSGAIEFVADRTRFLEARIAAGPVTVPVTDRFVLGGEAPIDGEHWRFTCDWSEGRLDGPVVATAIREFLPEIEQEWRSIAPDGPFAIGVEISDDGRRTDSRLRVESPGGSLQFAGTRLPFSTAAPVLIRIAPEAVGVTSKGLVLGDTPTTTLAGTATIGRGGDRELEFSGRIDFESLPSSTFDILPQGVRTTLGSIELSSTAPARIENLEVGCAWLPSDPPDAPSTIRAAGTVVLADAAFEAGLEFGEVDVRAAIEAGRDATTPLTLTGRVEASRLVVLGREVVDLSSRLSWSELDDQLRSEGIEGRLYGGLLRAEVDADLREERFEAIVHLDEVSAGRLISGERISSDPEEIGTPDALPDGDAGRLRGRLAIEGHFGDDPPEPWRIGRGRVSIEDGRIARDPLSMSILQLSQLMLPINDAIADLDASFHIENDRLALETIELQCDTMRLSGAGEVDLSTMTIDSLLEVRGRVPGLSDVLSPIAGLLYAVELEGPIAEPRSSLRLLPGLSDRPTPAIQMTRALEDPTP